MSNLRIKDGDSSFIKIKNFFIYQFIKLPIFELEYVFNLR